MKRIKHLTGLVTILLSSVMVTNAQHVGIGTTAPDVSAMLDVTATNKGLLIPRVSLTSLTDATTIASPATSLLVYNTNAAVPGGAGFYYNSGKGSAVWVKLLTGSGSGWALTGNAGTDSLTNFIGTTDAKPLVFRVNNGFAGQLGTLGSVALGRGANAKRLPDAGIIAIGDSALAVNQDNSNMAIGNGSLYNNTIGSGNTAIGNLAMVSNIRGSANVAVGELALASNDSSLNTAVGYQALANTQDEQNTAVGAYALSDNFSFYNTAVGSLALTSNQIGAGNTSIGIQTLYDNDGDLNTGGGFVSLSNNTTGSYNTAYGAYSLMNVTTGNYNTAIGDSADVANGTLINATAVGWKATATISNSVRIGNTFVTSIGGQVNWSVLSDGRYKRDVAENVKGLDFIMQLRPVTYHYDFGKVRGEKYNNIASSFGNTTSSFAGFNTSKAAGKLGGRTSIAKPASFNRINGVKTNSTLSKYYDEINQNDQKVYTGFIAQEVEAAAKKVGYDFSGVDKPKNETDQYALRYAEFVVPLVKAVQEQQAIIQAQNKTISDLQQRLEKLEAAKQ